MKTDPGRNDPCPCGSGKKYKYCCRDSESPDFEERQGKLFPGTLDDLIQEGYESFQDDNPQAADLWLDAWDRFKAFVDPDDRAIRDLDNRFSMTQSLFNWSQDIEMCLLNAGRNDDYYLKMQVQYCDEFRELFPESQESVLVTRGRAAAEACFHLGQVEEGEKRFEELLEEYPESPWAYLNWGDMYTLFRRHDDVPHDPERSRELYEKARPLLDEHEKEAAENRLNDLEEQY
ncbi:MAG: SEC-C metal-binding domain-containing protein [bacterium]